MLLGKEALKRERDIYSQYLQLFQEYLNLFKVHPTCLLRANQVPECLLLLGVRLMLAEEEAYNKNFMRSEDAGMLKIGVKLLGRVFENFLICLVELTLILNGNKF